VAELKTKANDASVADFLNAIPASERRQDCLTIAEIMEASAKAKPKMWGPSIVGFGEQRIVYAGGREADWMAIGFSPRKQNIVLYGVMGEVDPEGELMQKLGVHSCGKGCLYIKRLSDIHLPTLKKLVRQAAQRKTT
jgi:hypothetical protein